MDGRGQERPAGRGFSVGQGILGDPERTSGGAGGLRGSGPPAMIEVVFWNGFGLGGIELGALVEVVGDESLGDLVVFPTVGPHGKLGLGWAPGWMVERGRGGLADMGQDLCDGLGLGEERDEREEFLAGWTDQGEDFIDPGQESRPPGETRGARVRWMAWRLL